MKNLDSQTALKFILGISIMPFLFWNEEVLVSLCFFISFFLIYFNCTDAVTESLDERSDLIYKDLNSYVSFRQESLTNSILNERLINETSRDLRGMQNLIWSNFLKINMDQLKKSKINQINNSVRIDLNFLLEKQKYIPSIQIPIERDLKARMLVKSRSLVRLKTLKTNDRKVRLNRSFLKNELKAK